MNIPVPPLFLFEHELSRYEVMDGQQRVNTVLEFYRNELKLTGLESWAALNGLTRAKCPEKIRRGLDRRRLSAVVLLTESSGELPGGAEKLRQQVFERLNTGGQTLNPQELRNATFEGPFNDLIVELAGEALFNDAWEIPRYDDHYDKERNLISAELASNKLFQRMGDCEIVLRFFAFREVKNIKGSVRAMLDKCMDTNRYADPRAIDASRTSFMSALELAIAIFGKRTFQIKNDKGRWVHSKPVFDALMIASERLLPHAGRLIRNKKGIFEEFQGRLTGSPDFYDTLIGKANTAQSIKDRLQLMHDLLDQFK